MTATQENVSGTNAGPWIRVIEPEDLEMLRGWRNANASRFYDSEPVSAAGQQTWFESYLARPEDHLFLVMDRTEAIGCIGIRLRKDTWELYNVIRGHSSARSAGYMSQALALVIDVARKAKDVSVRAEVLADNPAVKWYQRNGFAIDARSDRAIFLTYRGHGKPPEGALP